MENGRSLSLSVSLLSVGLPARVDVFFVWGVYAFSLKGGVGVQIKIIFQHMSGGGVERELVLWLHVSLDNGLHNFAS